MNVSLLRERTPQVGETAKTDSEIVSSSITTDDYHSFHSELLYDLYVY